MTVPVGKRDGRPMEVVVSVAAPPVEVEAVRVTPGGIDVYLNVLAPVG